MSKMTMLDYIEEVYLIAYKNINDRILLTEKLVSYIKKNNIKRLWLIASGSSYNSCECIKLLFEKYTGISIKLISCYSFVYYENDLLDNDMAIVISQSGLSTNAIEALKKVKSLNKLTFCLTGNIDSDVKEYSDIITSYGVGVELVGYVSKGVTLLSLYFVLVASILSNNDDLIDDLKLALKLNKEVLNKSKDFVDANFKNLSSMHQCYLCGAGSSMGVVLEGALKIGETIHIPTSAYEIEEFLHGPNLQINPSYSIILFDGKSLAFKRVKQIYNACRQVSDRVYLITTNLDDDYLSDSNVLCISSKINEYLLSVVYLSFVQYLSYKISEECNTIKQHPLLKKFKKIASAKTSNYINYDGDE